MKEALYNEKIARIRMTFLIRSGDILRIRRNGRWWLGRNIRLVNEQSSFLWVVRRVMLLFKTRKTLDVFRLKVLGIRREERFVRIFKEINVFGGTTRWSNSISRQGFK